MMKYGIFFVLLAQLAYAQDAPAIEDYNPEVVSEWSSGKYFNDVNEVCIEDCNKTCVQKCPVPDLCNEDEIQCGKEDLPIGVWPDCIRDDLCVPKGCECKIILTLFQLGLLFHYFSDQLFKLFYRFRSNTRK